MKDLVKSGILIAILITALLMAKNVQGNSEKENNSGVKEKIEPTTTENPADEKIEENYPL